jgi:hypothetical protein
MPFDHLGHGLPHIGPGERRDQQLRRRGDQGGHDHPIRLQLRGHGLDRDGQPAAGPDLLPYPHDRQVEGRLPPHRPDGEIVRDRERVDQNGEPGVEHLVEGENGDTHGGNDLKRDIYDDSVLLRPQARWMTGDAGGRITVST